MVGKKKAAAKGLFVRGFNPELLKEMRIAALKTDKKPRQWLEEAVKEKLEREV